MTALRDPDTVTLPAPGVGRTYIACDWFAATAQGIPAAERQRAFWEVQVAKLAESGVEPGPGIVAGLEWARRFEEDIKAALLPVQIIPTSAAENRERARHEAEADGLLIYQREDR